MLSNPNHKSTAEEDALVTSIEEGTVIDVVYTEVVPDDEDSNNDIDQ